MSKFDFSAEALDEGLTDEDVQDFTGRTIDFKEAVERVDLKTAKAEQVRELYDSWLQVGQELFHISTKIVGVTAVKEAPPSVKKSLANTLLAHLTPVFDRFRRGE